MGYWHFQQRGEDPDIVLAEDKLTAKKKLLRYLLRDSDLEQLKEELKEDGINFNDSEEVLKWLLGEDYISFKVDLEGDVLHIDTEASWID